ncbi:ABC transporter substrate-binding protein [Lentzea sp. JNUCC 0626]|uniref:ABC transporter substrate-binding protein n=1 Tax=Lentzea sp. JNUCC 0626 TaxID=3367513 RepID=UPI003747AD79
MLRRRIAFSAMLATCVLTAGCFTGGTSQDAAVLRVAMPFAPKQAMSPWGDDGALLTQLGIAETLVGLAPDGSPQPLLAQSWTRRSATTWQFHLREGVKFHDGLELRAQHVANAFTAATRASPIPHVLKGLGLTATAEGDNDLVVSTTEPDPTLPERLAAPNLVILSSDAYQADGVRVTGTGTGPFVLNEITGNSAARLTGFQDYWHGPPRLSGVDVRFIPDGPGRSAALRAGEVDVATALPATTHPDSATAEIPLPRTVSLLLNTSQAPMADPRLRRVVRDAVDADAIARAVYQGHADPARGIFGPATPWATTPPPPEPAKARAGGEPFVLATYSERAELPEVASVVAQWLRGKGFSVEQVVRQYSQLEPDLLAGKFDGVIISRSYALDSGDPAAYLAIDFGCSGGYNIAKLCDLAVDSAIADSLATPEPGARRAAVLKAQKLVLDSGAVVPLVHERAIIGRSPHVEGLSLDPHGQLLVRQDTSLR